MATYTTSNGNTYEFSFERQSNGSVRTYIDRQPSYGSRATDSLSTHRFEDGSRHYICWRPQPTTLRDAQAVAAQWAKRTDRFIRFGVPIEAPGSTPARDEPVRAMSS